MTTHNAVNADRLLDTFLELLAIDSPSHEEEAVIRHLDARLTQFGLETRIDETGNLIGRLAGAGEPLLLCAHVDHVPPCRGIQPVVDGDLIRTDGSTVLGGDDTSGVAIILEILHLLQVQRQHTGEESPALEIAFTVQEEVGMCGSKAMDLSLLAARQGIVLDMGGPRGAIVVQGPSQHMIHARVHGRKSHAATAPEQGINAIRVASEAIAAMPLGRVDEETTANIGVIHGGTATNIVPDLVEIEGEARSQNEEKLQHQTEVMVHALHEAAGRHGAHVEVDVELAYRGYRIPDDAPLVMALGQAMRQFGIEPLHMPTAGGSDANIFNEHGIQTVNISTGMTHVHSTEERIHLSEMVACAQLLAHLLHIWPAHDTEKTVDGRRKSVHDV